MFKKVLVANRGEIAVRVIRALRELGIRSVAVYSEADSDSMHVELADEAVCIGPAQAQKSYLNIPSIISAAEITKSEAIHPGYGFLSENETFAEICDAHGIKFIGPSPEVMKLMANKTAAKRIMGESGVPVIPEIEVDFLNIDEIEKKIDPSFFPVLIKAAYGGGGRGIRKAENLESLKELIKTASAEAESAFGSGEIYLERFFEKPRHIEFQVIADNYGNVKVFDERDCSIQRRNQKIIEETPCDILPEGLREETKEKIARAIKDLGYTNAGTLEFLFDGNNLYFMEINTRLQVEHPITEEFYDVDIVKEQIRVAAGEKLSEEISEAEPSGHVFEFRINAEEPERDFTPSPGTIAKLRLPGGPGVRIDTHIYEGYTISPYYDSLIAKVIVRGLNRKEALNRGLRALNELRIEGIKTNRDFIISIINDDEYRNQKFYTRYIEEVFMKEYLSRVG